MTYTHGGTADTDYSRLVGSAYSPFLKQEIYGNNSVMLESINEVGVLASMLLNVQLNDSDKRGLIPALGFDYKASLYSSATMGHTINESAPNQLVFEYAIIIIIIIIRAFSLSYRKNKTQANKLKK